jgi:hypothetical protein
MEVEKIQKPSVFLVTYRNLSHKSGDLDFCRENLANLGHFFHEKSFE